MKRIALAWVVWMLAGSACAAPRLAPEDWEIEGGSRLGTWAASDSAVVVIVLDPVNGFTCASQLAEWLAWRSENPSRLRLVFSRHPRGAEAKLLRTVRLPVEAVLRQPPPVRLPAELVFVRGALVHADSALEGRHSPLLLSLRSNRLEAALALVNAPAGRQLVRSPTLTPENSP